MRKTPIALFSGTGRHVAGAVVIGGLAVLVLGLLLQAGKQQRQYRAMHQQQLQQAAVQAAELARSRIDHAAVLLRVQADAAAQLRYSPQFGSVTVFQPAGNTFVEGERRFTLGAREREALEAGNTVLLAAGDAAGEGGLYLLRSVGAAPRAHWALAELRGEWLWSELGAPASDARFAVFDSRGQRHFGSADGALEIGGHVMSRLGRIPARGAGSDLSWNEAGAAWVGAMARIASDSVASDRSFAMVAMAPDRPWTAALLSAVRTQSTMLPLLLLLAAWFAYDFSQRHVQPLKALRRAVAHLPDRRIVVPVAPGAPLELRQLIETYNRSAEIIESQSGTRRVLDEIDALLLAGGDYENVIDQVLTRIRAVTCARNVGLTLIEPGVAGHGRLFVVSADGGAPVNRVLLDPEMVSTLRDADTGLTIARCEEGRHNFLEPLQQAGAEFFWVWPVMAADELAAILAVGYAEPPGPAARVAETGTLCAWRLGLSFTSNARAERLYRQAHFDPLTQLPNRQLFREKLQLELDRAQGGGTRGALLYIDLDHFKRVNDALGHEAGDALLEVVAKRLLGCVKEDDTVARLGGDEFTVILRDIHGNDDVAEVAERIIGSMRTPVRLGGRDHLVQASIGITLFPADGTGLDELLHHADIAMYRAKDLGRSAAVFYSANLESRRMTVADSGLYRAMKRREFSLYYQPQYGIADGRLVGAEALLRWQNPRNGLMVSAEFIPAAEKSGIIVDLGCWVIESACAQFAQWRDAGMDLPRLALNISTQQLRDPELLAALQRQLDRFRLRPDCMEFEMSESSLTDPDSAPAIEALSALGVRLTLDDFGTGNTALGNLRRYPVSAVKIDRSFVEKLGEDPAAAALAGTIIVMAHALDKQVIAEGVESIEQLDYLREHGCDMAQGFFMARPLSATEMGELLLGRGIPQETGRSAIA